VLVIVCDPDTIRTFERRLADLFEQIIEESLVEQIVGEWIKAYPDRRYDLFAIEYDLPVNGYNPLVNEYEQCDFCDGIKEALAPPGKLLLAALSRIAEIRRFFLLVLAVCRRQRNRQGPTGNRYQLRRRICQAGIIATTA
jgi:hypothetical protein